MRTACRRRSLPRSPSAALLAVLSFSAVAGGNGFEADDVALHRLAAPCLDCHAVDLAPTDRVGPTLQGVVGRRVADIDGYHYSAALYRKAAIGVVWDEVTLDRFLEAPRAVAPGSGMAYAGVPDADDRARLIAWLASGPVPLPAESVAAAREPTPEVAAVLRTKADPRYGEYLAGKCLTCHFASGASGSIPPIEGLPADYFVGAMLEYQQGERSNRVMSTMSELLGAEELAALADYFSRPAP